MVVLPNKNFLAMWCGLDPKQLLVDLERLVFTPLFLLNYTSLLIVQKPGRNPGNSPSSSLNGIVCFANTDLILLNNVLASKITSLSNMFIPP